MKSSQYAGLNCVFESGWNFLRDKRTPAIQFYIRVNTRHLQQEGSSGGRHGLCQTMLKETPTILNQKAEMQYPVRSGKSIECSRTFQSVLSIY